MAYAEQTTVSPEKSRMEIEQTLNRYGAERFAYMTEPGRAVVMFDVQGRRVRFVIRIPAAKEFETYRRTNAHFDTQRTDTQRDKAWAQEVRRRWRALYLVIKAKVESVESGIETLDEAFLPHLVLPDGRTFSEWAVPQLDTLGTNMPPLLTAPVEEAEIIEMEERR